MFANSHRLSVGGQYLQFARAIGVAVSEVGRHLSHGIGASCWFIVRG